MRIPDKCLCPLFLCSPTQPTNSHLSSPLLLLPAPAPCNSIPMACVWILMLITPRLKIAVQSVVSQRNFFAHDTHRHSHIYTPTKEGIIKTVCCAPQQELKSREWSLRNCIFLFFRILPSNSCFSIRQIFHARMRHCINYILNSKLFGLNHGWCYFIVGGEVASCDFWLQVINNI